MSLKNFQTKHSNVGAALEYPITVLNVRAIITNQWPLLSCIRCLVKGLCDLTLTLSESLDNIMFCDYQVESILVIGHSCCGGIKGLMAIEDDAAPYKRYFSQKANLTNIVQLYDQAGD